MTDKILRVISQEESWRNEVHADVVETLETLLEEAKEGRIIGLAYATLEADSATFNGSTRTTNLPALIGSLERCKYRMMQQMDDE